MALVVALAAVLALVVVGAPAAVTADEATGSQLGSKITRFELQPSDDPRLRRAWKRWVKARTPQYLTRTQRDNCECVEQPLVRTVIRRGRLVSVHDLRDGSTLPWSDAQPMDKLFRLLRKGYRMADDVQVNYGKRGVPRDILIDWSSMAADEETGYKVRVRTGL